LAATRADVTRDPAGTAVHANRVRFLVRTVWGKVVYLEDVAGFDELLSRS
jgi:hypothetical protein